MGLKKVILLFAGALFAVGFIFMIPTITSALDKKEGVKNIHTFTHHMPKVATLQSKLVELEYSLVDPRDQSVIRKINQKEIESEKFKQDVKGLVKELANKYDQPMVPAKRTAQGGIVPGVSRVILDEAELTSRLLSEPSIFEKVIELPIIEEIPNVSVETIQGIDEVILGSYKTSFNANVKGRTTNIVLSAAEINEIVLGPGDRFYFNLIVGNTTPDKGYQLATVIENKQFVEGYGGGVCQTSSTLYNAVDAAGLEILELHHHSKEVGYVPIGRDATIAYGGKDFKFMNNNDFPIIIKTIVDDKSGTIEVQLRTSAQYVTNN